MRGRRVRIGVVAALGLLVAVGPGCGRSEPDASPADAPPAATRPAGVPADARGPVTPVRVVDGDTLRVRDGGDELVVRVLGIDTPESVDPRRPVECFGREAAAAAARLVGDGPLWLEADPTQDAVDRFDRVLAHVRLADGRLLSDVLVAEGYAFESVYDGPTRYQEVLVAAEEEARRSGRGLWAPGACGGQDAGPLEATGSPDAPPTVAVDPSGCDPGYRGVCVPPYPPDVDCADLGGARPEVVGDDPHRLDGDGDGVGCGSRP